MERPPRGAWRDTSALPIRVGRLHTANGCAARFGRPLAQQVGIAQECIVVAENGQVVELTGGVLRLGQRIPGGYVFVDGEFIGDIDHGVMREREQLARNGILLIDLSVNKLTGRLTQEPEVNYTRLPRPGGHGTPDPEVRKAVMQIVNHNGMDTEKDIASAVKSYLHQETKRRPMVFVTLSRS